MHPTARPDDPATHIARVLEHHGLEPRRSLWFDDTWEADCPVRRGHLLILRRLDSGRAELTCLDGCSEWALCRALRLDVFDFARPFRRAA